MVNAATMRVQPAAFLRTTLPLDLSVLPALDSGRYWQGFFKYPGDITIQFLEAVPPGLKRDAFMQLLQERIETATASLLALK